MTDNEIKTICEKIESLHAKILKSKFAETATKSEMLSLILAVKELNHLQAENERLKEETSVRDKIIDERGAEVIRHDNAIRSLHKQLETAKTEAYKEFTKELKEHMCFYDLDNYHSFRAVEEDVVDALLEEKLKIR